jgi:hypothetical protein
VSVPYRDWHPDTGFLVARALKHRSASEIHQAILGLMATAPLDKVRVYRGGIYTWGGSAVTMNNDITFPRDGYVSDFALGNVSVDQKQWFAHEIFHVYEHQTTDYHWTDGMLEHLRYSDPYSVPGTHEQRAADFEHRFRP